MVEQTLKFLRSQQIIVYMAERFGPVDDLGMQEILPIVEDMSVSINFIRPNDDHPYLVLFTNGMSDRAMRVPSGSDEWQYAELVMHLPADWPHPREAGGDPQWLWPVQWLRKAAYIPHLNDTWLAPPGTIISSAVPPEKLGPNTEQTCLLLLPRFANLTLPLETADVRVINFWTVVPLYTAERDYELQNGMQAFYQRFMEAKVSVTVDVARQPFAEELLDDPVSHIEAIMRRVRQRKRANEKSPVKHTHDEEKQVDRESPIGREAATCLLSPRLPTVLEELGIDALLRLATPDTRAEKLVFHALNLARNTLRRHPQELAFQLQARLQASRSETPELTAIDSLPPEQSVHLRACWPCGNQAGGLVLLTLENSERHIGSLAVSPGGQYVVSATWDYELRVWELDTGRAIFTLEAHDDAIDAVSISYDGRFIISASSDGTIKMWQLSDGELVRTLDAEGTSIRSIALSPDGRHVVAGCGSYNSPKDDCIICMWEIDTGSRVRTFNGHSRGVNGIALTLDGVYVVSGSWDNSVKIFELSTGKLLATLEGHEDRVTGVGVTPDGRSIVSGSWDGTLKRWDLDTRKLIYSINAFTERIDSIALSADGSHIVSGSFNGLLKIWELSTGELIATLPRQEGAIRYVAFSPFGKRVISCPSSNSITVWDWTGAELRQAEEGHIDEGHIDPVTDIAISPDASLIATSSFDQTIKLWERETGRLTRTLQGHESWVQAVTISPDGRFVITASGGIDDDSKDNTVRIWELGTGTLKSVLEGHTKSVECVAITPDGQFVVSGSEDTIKIWEFQSGRLIRTLNKRRVESVAISPDGRRIISGAGDGTIDVWELDTGTLNCTINAYAQFPVCSVAVSPDGLSIVSASWDTEIKLWEVATGRLVRSMDGHQNWVQ